MINKINLNKFIIYLYIKKTKVGMFAPNDYT